MNRKKAVTCGGSGEIASAIRAMRIEKGWSQAVLGEKVGMGQGRVSAIERGNVKLTVPMLDAIAGALGKRLVVSFEDERR